MSLRRSSPNQKKVQGGFPMLHGAARECNRWAAIRCTSRRPLEIDEEQAQLFAQHRTMSVVVGRMNAANVVGVRIGGTLDHHAHFSTVGNKDEMKEDGSSSSLGPYDVLCGRSAFALNSVGNRRFRIIVSLALPRYLSAPTRAGRTAAIDSVVASVKASGGRFLRRQGVRWIELDDKQAREKVGHALRDMASSSTSSSWDDDNHDNSSVLLFPRGFPSPPTTLRNLSTAGSKGEAEATSAPWSGRRRARHVSRSGFASARAAGADDLEDGCARCFPGLVHGRFDGAVDEEGEEEFNWEWDWERSSAAEPHSHSVEV